MNLGKVKYTKLRGGTYHLNIPIPASIRAEYNGRVAFERTTGSSDHKEAERQVTAQRAEFNLKVKDAQRRADQSRLKDLLDVDDAATADALGGPSGISPAIDRLRQQTAFLLAGEGAFDTIQDHDIDTARLTFKDPVTGKFWNSDANPYLVDTGGEELSPDVLHDIKLKAEGAAHKAFSDAITAEIRKLKSTAAALSEPVTPAPDWADEGVTGIRELAEKMAAAKSYTKQLRDSLRYTVRRWVELHGDITVTKFERSHLNRFSDALKGVPITREKRVQSLPINKAITIAKAERLDTMGDKIRQTRCDHMKALTAFAVNQLGILPADPFAGYSIIKGKVKHSAKAKTDTKPYSPEQVRLILPHCAANFNGDTLDRWAPIISAYTGARREEIGQLAVSDVKDWGNGLTINITDEGEDQTVKNKHSFRTIPVPPILQEAGFGDFIARRREAGGVMLFMEDYSDRHKAKALREVQTTGRGRYTETYGERYSRHVRKPLGITEPGLTFHSMRHSWTDAARRAKIDPEIRRLIAGRLDDVDVKSNAVESAYGGADLLQEKLDAMIAVTPYLTKD